MNVMKFSTIYPDEAILQSQTADILERNRINGLQARLSITKITSGIMYDNHIKKMKTMNKKSQNRAIILPMALLLLFYACAETDKPAFEAPARNLESTIMMDRDSEMLIGRTNFITMLRNSLCIRGVYEGYNYSEYNIETRQIHRFGKHGQGPGEMVNPGTTVSSISINDTAYLCIFDIGTRRICLFEEKDILANKKIYRKAIPFGSDSVYDMSLDVFLLNDSVFLATGYFSGYACKMSNNNNFEKKYAKAFTKTGEETDYRRVWADANKFDLSPDKLHIVRITQRGGLIEEYKITGGELQQLFHREYFDVMVANHFAFTSDTRYGYIDVTISNNRIYALYSGVHVFAVDENKVQTDCQSKTVHVYDMNGKELETLLLDKFVGSIAVKADDTELYALSTFEKDLLLYKLN